MAALYVSSKMHDTLKKPREILMVAYAVRFPELAAKSKSVAGEVDIDPAVSTMVLYSIDARILKKKLLSPGILDGGARPAAVTSYRATNTGNHLFQLHSASPFLLYYQDRS